VGKIPSPISKAVSFSRSFLSSPRNFQKTGCSFGSTFLKRYILGREIFESQLALLIGGRRRSNLLFRLRKNYLKPMGVMEQQSIVAGTLLMSMFMLSSGVSVAADRASGSLFSAPTTFSHLLQSALIVVLVFQGTNGRPKVLAPCRDPWFAYQSQGRLSHRDRQQLEIPFGTCCPAHQWGTR